MNYYERSKRGNIRIIWIIITSGCNKYERGKKLIIVHDMTFSRYKVESLMRLAFLVDRAWPRASAFYCFHCARYAVNRARPIIAINFTLDLLKRLCSRLLYHIAHDEKKMRGRKILPNFCLDKSGIRGKIKIMKFNSITKLKKKKNWTIERT